MRKHDILIITSLFLATFLCIPKGHAGIYIGGDTQYRSVKLLGNRAEVMPKTSFALNTYLGFPMGNNFCLEAGFHSAKSTKETASLKMKGIHGSLVKYFSLDKEGNFYAFGSIGLAQLRHNARHFAYRLDLSRCVPRLASGVQYSLTESVKVRGAFSWENAKALSKKPMRSNNSYVFSLGLNYEF